MTGARIPVDPPFTVTVDGADVVCARPDAAWWIGHLADANWLGLVLEVAPHTEARLWDPDDVFDLDDAARLAIAVTEHATRLPWQRAVRLAATIAADWPRHEAWAVTNAPGVDLATAPPRRALAVVQAMLLAGCEKESEVDRLMRRLDDPVGVPGLTSGARRAAFTMSAAELAALQEPMPMLKGAPHGAG